jgi:hypothetical protein
MAPISPFNSPTLFPSSRLLSFKSGGRAKLIYETAKIYCTGVALLLLQICEKKLPAIFKADVLSDWIRSTVIPHPVENRPPRTSLRETSFFSPKNELSALQLKRFSEPSWLCTRPAAMIVFLSTSISEFHAVIMSTRQ